MIGLLLWIGSSRCSMSSIHHHPSLLKGKKKGHTGNNRKGVEEGVLAGVVIGGRGGGAFVTSIVSHPD